ncbi:hypothetical protein [Paraburkholderia terrae]|uniref:Uncharacterized protein n=1 Tax=Paraburkholderia terrae TaxID=311230 RepID=A0A2I8F3L6_9BURK|nr:hypothetical protein [Paraburkholderia terrae]AUT66131.1 hypothetical protein C2L65_35790 [Paraburkholderia terrae]
MSQARGPYAGSRRNGQRQFHHDKRPPVQRQGSPYVKPAAKDSDQTASILKTRSFQFLVSAVGAENIALALESNMTRVAELMKGERFTPETAFHVETTLGLPHGFFDQPHPALADETIARLKSPLDFIRTDEEFDPKSEALESAPTPAVDQQPIPKVSLPEEAQMPKKVAGGKPAAVKNSRNEVREQPKTGAPLKVSSPKHRTSSKTPQQQPLALSDNTDVENIRRANLRLLTTRNGSKVRLGVVMEMSGFNIADRLHGKKRMDSAEANRFTERLGLPIGWLDSPRTEGEIPESVSQMLTPAPRGHASVQQRVSPAPATNDGEQEKTASGKLRTHPERATASDAPERASPVAANVAKDKGTIVVSREAQVNELSPNPASPSTEENDSDAPAVTLALPDAMTDSPIPQQPSFPLPITAATSLDNLHGIAPIAEALIKTLAGKARTGRLDELKALELLHQAVLL